MPTHDLPPKLPPKFDAVFQLLFNDQDHCRLLISLLNGLLQLPSKMRIIELTLLPPRLQGTTAGEKCVVLDIRALTADGRRYNIDVQVAPFHLYEIRALYYWSGLYHGQIPTGAKYKDVRPAIGVHILDFSLDPDEPRYHQIFDIRERFNHKRLTDHLELHMVELSKFNLTLDQLANEEQKWLFFLKHGHEMSAEQAQALGLPEIAEAERKLGMISQDQLLQMQHEQWDKAQRDQVAMRLDWIEYGREEGEKSGEKKGLQNGIRSMCRVLGIELTAQREDRLRSLDEEGLQALLSHLESARRWD